MRDEQRDVADSLAQRRKLQLDRVDAVEQVATKHVLIDQLLKRTVRGGDEAEIRRQFFHAPDAANALGLEYTQELRLQRRGQIADLVQEQRPAVRKLDQADFSGGGACKGALLMSKKLRLGKRLGYSSAVQRDEWLLRATRQAMELARDQLFPGSGLPMDEDRHVGIRDPAQKLEQVGHPRILGHDAHVRRVALGDGTEALGARDDLARLGRLPYQSHEAVPVDRLLEKVVSAQLHRLGRGRNRAVAGQEDHLRPLWILPDRLKHLEAVEPRHAQVEDRDVEDLLA